MNYLVLGIALVIGAVWLLVIIVSALAKAAEEGAAAANRLGAASARGFGRWVRRLARDWVEIQIPADLSEFEFRISEGRSAAHALMMWKPSPIAADDPHHTEFRPFQLPDVRGVSTQIHLNDLEELRVMTDPKPADVLQELASRSCSFPDSKPAIPSHETNWPASLSRIVLQLPRSRFEFRKSQSLLRWIARRAYSSEYALAGKLDARVNSLTKELDEVNASIAQANSQLAIHRELYRAKLEKRVNSRFAAYTAAKDAYSTGCLQETAQFRDALQAYMRGDGVALLGRFRQGLRLVSLPDWFSTNFEAGLDETGRALIIDVELPNLPDVALGKTVVTPTGRISDRSANKRESTQALAIIHPLALLRIACEAARLDTTNKVDLVAVNGWVSYRARTTGKPKTAYVASLIGAPEELRSVWLPRVDPIAAFKHFRGQSAFVVDDVVPLKPQLILDRSDPRFVEAKDVMEALATNTNLATMDWQDFEHLIRDLFERLYQGKGVEVKVTQASRDRGVDAVVLDPDPIRGGKTVIQAKRYVNTVDVSAVRDLFGTVHNEGASRGILVTTSTFGPDSYQFAADKPLTLINGTQLLAYLKEAGKNVRIDLEEARRLANP